MTSGGQALSAALEKINRKWLVGIVVGVALALLVQKLMNPAIAVHEGMTAPDFALESTDGKIFTLTKLRGIPVIVTFWGTECADCLSEIPGKSAFARAHPEVQMLGIAVDSGDLDTLDAARHELGITYPVLESNAEVESKYGLQDLPVTLLIDDQGVIQKLQEGMISKQRLAVWTR